LDRLPPHDLDAEESVLGSILIDDEAIFKVAPTLRPEDFYREKNGWIYAACLSLQDRNEAINQVTVAYELTHQDRLESVGGPAYLSTLVANVPTSIHVEQRGRADRPDRLRGRPGRRLHPRPGRRAPLRPAPQRRRPGLRPHPRDPRSLFRGDGVRG
jgi:hypothetical protein